MADYYSPYNPYNTGFMPYHTSDQAIDVQNANIKINRTA